MSRHWQKFVGALLLCATLGLTTCQALVRVTGQPVAAPAAEAVQAR